jgi:hypothetical protein
MITEARKVFNTIKALMPSRATKNGFTSAMNNHTRGNGKPRPQSTKGKASSLSRYYNKNDWDVQMVMDAMQSVVLGLILTAYKHCKGFAQVLDACIDLTTLEKTGDFPALPVCVLNSVKGLHIVVLYVCLAGHKYPFAYGIWKGKGKASVSDLALALVKQLQRGLPNGFKIRLLADTAFGTTQLLEACHARGIQAVTGIARDRKTLDGYRLDERIERGACVYLKGCKIPVWVSWFKLFAADDSFEWRFVVSTKAGNWLSIIKWGRGRWIIEAFFKCMKSRFGLDQFGQRTLNGVICFLALCFLAYILTAISRPNLKEIPDWQELAAQVRRELLPWLCWIEVERERELLIPILKQELDNYASIT